MDKNQLKEMYSNQQYQQIADLWQEYLSSAEQEPLDVFSYVYIIQGLYKLQNYKECLAVYKKFQGVYPDSDQLNNKMGYSVYHVYLKNHDFAKGDNQAYKKQVDYILQKCKNEDYSPYMLVYKHICRAIKKKMLSQEIDYRLWDNYLNKVNPEDLSSLPSQTNDGRSLASDKENWYFDKATVLEKLKQYEECCRISREALQSLHRFHSNHDVWLRLKIVNCLMKIQDFEGAHREMDAILQGQIPHYKIWQTAFELEVKSGSKKKAEEYFAQCALSKGEEKFMVGFLASAVYFLLNNNYIREAQLHYALVNVVRQEQNWKPYKWEKPLELPEEIASMGKQQLLKELRSIWQQWRDQNKVFVEGNIKTILPSGRDGFITSDEGMDYYFNFRDAAGKISKFQPGSRVRFEIVERFNKKKNRKEENAVTVSLV